GEGAERLVVAEGRQGGLVRRGGAVGGLTRVSGAVGDGRGVAGKGGGADGGEGARRGGPIPAVGQAPLAVCIGQGGRRRRRVEVEGRPLVSPGRGARRLVRARVGRVSHRRPRGAGPSRAGPLEPGFAFAELASKELRPPPPAASARAPT